jgi:hypothetical protein
MRASRIAFQDSFFNLLLILPLSLLAEDCHIVAGTTATLTLVEAFDADTLTEQAIPFQARVLSDIESPNGDHVILAGSTFVLSARTAPFHDVRMEVKQLIASGEAFENLGVEIASVVAAGVSVSGGLVRQTRRVLFRSMTGPVRLRPGTQIKILFTEHKIFPCPRARAAEPKSKTEGAVI